MGPKYRGEDWPREQYHERGLTQGEIADERGVSPRTIRKYMKRFGIETREVKGENHGSYGKEFSDSELLDFEDAHCLGN